MCRAFSRAMFSAQVTAGGFSGILGVDDISSRTEKRRSGSRYDRDTQSRWNCVSVRIVKEDSRCSPGCFSLIFSPLLFANHTIDEVQTPPPFAFIDEDIQRVDNQKPKVHISTAVRGPILFHIVIDNCRYGVFHTDTDLWHALIRSRGCLFKI